MKKLQTRLDDDARQDRASLLWRYIGRSLATIASGILLAIVIVHGESWAIRQAPFLLTDSATALMPGAGCVPEDNPDAGALPVAILH
jgi:hypothetical protein